MKIAVVCPYAWDLPGGVQSHVRSLAAALAERGHAVLVLAPLSGRPPSTPFPASSEGFGFTPAGRALRLPMNGSVAPIAFGPRGFGTVRLELARFGPEIVHLHEPLIPSTSMQALLAADAPMVATFHAAAPSSKLYRVFRPLLRRWSHKLKIKTVVSAAAQELIGRYVPGPFELTPNGVDVDRLRQGNAPAPDGKRVLFLGRLERRKGLELLVRAMASVDAQLIVAGEGPELERCERLARELGIEARFVGVVDDDEKARLYRSASVFCAPNLGGESFGIVLLEAMAAGVPVVCSDIDGFMSAAGGAARHFASEDPSALAAALRAVLSDPSAADELARLGRERAESFAWSRLVDGVIRIYERALS